MTLVVDPILHIGLLHSVVQRTGPHPDEEEIFRDAQYGLVKACRDFRPELGFEFSTVATKYIRTEIQKHYRVKHAKKRDASRTTSLTDLTALKAGRWDSPGDLERQDEELDRIIQLENILCRMPEHMAEVLLCRAEGMTLEEIASKIGVSRETVRKLERQAMVEAHKAAGVEGVFFKWADATNANNNRRKRMGFPPVDKSKPSPREMVRY